MDDLYEHIGQKIRELRNAKSLSQEDFGQRIKIPTNTISRWETATYKPSAEDLAKLAKHFAVSITYFFPDVEQPNLTSDLQALMSASAELTQTDIKELTEYAIFRKARAVLESKSRKKTKK